MSAAVLSRRQLVGGCLCGGALCALPAATLAQTAEEEARGPGYQPTDQDERGIWAQLERVEEEIRTSDQLVRDPALTGYLKGVTDRITGGASRDFRLYLYRSADFNAGMYPNGMIVVNTGLLIRMANEAQLAAVLGHESGHYLKNHVIKAFRNQKRRFAIANFLSLGLGLGGIAAGVNTYDLVTVINNGLFLGAFSYSRDLEREADDYGLRLLARAGYDPMSASLVWQQLIAERQASADERRKRRRRGYSLLATHPATDERMKDLATDARAMALEKPGATDDGAERYAAAMAAHMPAYLDDQVKLNDPGASLYLVSRLATGGWTAPLRLAEGDIYGLRDRDGDADRAFAAYTAAVSLPEPPTRAWRAYGYGAILRGQGEQGRTALQRYLELDPHAPDAAIVRHTLT